MMRQSTPQKLHQRIATLGGSDLAVAGGEDESERSLMPSSARIRVNGTGSKRRRRRKSSNKHNAPLYYYVGGMSCIIILFVLYVGGVYWVIFYEHSRGSPVQQQQSSFSISSIQRPSSIVQTHDISKQQHEHNRHNPRYNFVSKIYRPHHMHDADYLAGRYPDFGELTALKIFQDDGQARVVYQDLRARRGVSRDEEDGLSKSRIWYDYVFAYDDDVARTPYAPFDDDAIADKFQCRRVNWHRENHMNCNSVHELDILLYMTTWESKYLGAGAFREAFLLNHPTEPFVFKQQLYDDKYDDESREYMRVDSLIMDIFTSSPLVLDVYGFCALSQLIEPMPHGDLEQTAVINQPSRSQRVNLNPNKLDPKNHLSLDQKLTFSIEMAQGVAMLHNYPRGMIVHDDIHMGQFLLSEDQQHLKMQDFNRGEILLWSEKQNRYCGYKNGRGHGDWRSPEEYHDYSLDEKIDIWSLGNNMYSVLTGLQPFYQVSDSKSVRELVKAGKTAWIDPRYSTHSVVEQKIVEAIERCWAYKPEDRATASEILQILMEAKKSTTNTTNKVSKVVKPRGQRGSSAKGGMR